MIHIKQAVIVEGKYDKIRLSGILDALIIPTNGFSVFKDPEKRNWIRNLAKERGVVILTDSDRAGRDIRNYIRSFIGKEGTVYNVYIPQIPGKEKRKIAPSKEGTMGVEGMSSEVLLKAFAQAGVTEEKTFNAGLTKADLMEAGLVGTEGSSDKRRFLLKKLSLPQNLSANALLRVINSSFTKEEFLNICHQVEEELCILPM